MKRILISAMLAVAVFLLSCCDLSELGTALNSTSGNLFAVETEVDSEVEAAKAEIKALLDDTKDILAKSFYIDGGTNKTNETYYSQLMDTMARYNELSAKYSDNPKAWSAIRTYLRYATICDYPDILNEEGDGETSLYEACLALKRLTFTKETKLIQAIAGIFGHDNKEAFGFLKRRIIVAKPSRSGSSTILYSSSDKTITVDNYEPEIMDYTLGDGVEYLGNGTFSGPGSSSKNVTYKVTFSLKDDTMNEWTDGTTSDVTVSWTVYKEAPASDTRPKVTFTAKLRNDQGSMINANGAKLVYSGSESRNLTITATNGGDSVDYVLTIKRNGKVVDEVLLPGSYTISVKPASSSYKGSLSASFKIVDPVEGMYNELGYEVANSLLSIALSLDGDIIPNTADSGKPYQNTVASYATIDPDFMDYIIDEYDPQSTSSKVYLYSDLLSALYLNVICDCLEETIGILEMDGSALETRTSSAYSGLLCGTDLGEPLSLDEFNSALSVFSSFRSSIDAMRDYDGSVITIDDFNVVDNPENLRKLTQILNVMAMFKNTAVMFSKESIVGELDYFISCLRAAVRYSETMYRFGEDGEAVYAISPYMSSILTTFETFIEDMDEYTIGAEYLDVDADIQLMLDMAAEALNLADEVNA